MARPIPIDKEQNFEINEIFFSSTDKVGNIKTCNSIFERISGYASKNLIGAPHNIIRHPDMPRSVFKLLWDFILAGKPISAYVKNMAKDGSYYWVVASVFPIKDEFISIRLKPISQYLEIVKGLYKKILQEEARNGIAGGTKLLLESLQSLGFQDYETFMSKFLIEEISLFQTMQQSKSNAQSQVQFNSYSMILEDAILARQDLSKALNNVKKFDDFNQLVLDGIAKITKEFKSLRVLTVNMSLSANQLGKGATTLSVISDSFQKFSNETQNAVDEFTKYVGNVSKLTSIIQYSFSTTIIQILMLEFFLDEMLQSNHHIEDEKNLEKIKLLTQTTVTYCEDAVIKINDAKQSLMAIVNNSIETDNSITALDVIRQTGKVECVQIEGGVEAIGPYLNHLKNLMDSIRGELRRIREGAEETLSLCQSINRQIAEAQKNIRGTLKSTQMSQSTQSAA